MTLEEIRLAPLPCWRDLAKHQLRMQVHDLVVDIEREGRSRERATGQPPLGRDLVLRQDPRHEPNRLKKGPAPLAHTASRGARDALKGAYRIFLAAYRHAAERLRLGALDAIFPAGSFPPALPYRPAYGQEASAAQALTPPAQRERRSIRHSSERAPPSSRCLFSEETSLLRDSHPPMGPLRERLQWLPEAR